jgi:hypothetical protein
MSLTLAVASTALSQPATVIQRGDLVGNTRLLADCLQERLRGRLPFVPRLSFLNWGIRRGAPGAIMTVLARPGHLLGTYEPVALSAGAAGRKTDAQKRAKRSELPLGNTSRERLD